MIHAQQKGYTPPEILRGLCDAVARNFKSSIVKGRKVDRPGGPDRRGLAERRRDGGAARGVRAEGRRADRAGAVRLVRRGGHRDAGDRGAPQADLPRHPPPEPARVGSAACRTRRRSRWRTWSCCATASTPLRAARRATSPFRPSWASTSARCRPTWWPWTSGARVIHDVYLRTAGRPIEAVQQGLAEIEREWGSRLVIEGVGTTGSGRELIAELVGADVVNDEITAHKTGALHVSALAGRRARGHDLRDRRPGLQVHLHRERRGGGLRHERSLRRGHRLVPGGAGREAGHQHQGRVRPAGAFLGQRPRGWASAARCSWSAT